MTTVLASRDAIAPQTHPQEPLQQAYLNTRQLSLKLVEPLSEADVQLQSMPDASPSKWHLAHTTWFFERFILANQIAGYRDYQGEFNYLFNSYYNGIGEQYARAHRGLISRPSLAEIISYRQAIDELMMELLSDGQVAHELAMMVELGIHHEQQHQELLLTDIKHALSHNPLFPAYRQASIAINSQPQALNWHEHTGGLVECGHSSSDFAFDNESPCHKVYLKPFRLASRLATNAEYIAFIEDGAYSNPLLWLADGWAWSQQNKVSLPLYWRKQDSHYFAFTLHGDTELDLHSPVTHLNYFEANAFANWAGKRLPTEFEWEAIAQQQKVEGRFLNFDYLHPRGKLADEQTNSSVFGDVWQWTSSSYGPYPGFRAFAGKAGEYNGKFMGNQYVLRGGSCVSVPGHIRATYRNFFYAHQAWQFTGIRLAEDEQ